ncbi:DNA-binding transcriptional LysR family regulator [Mumia flava]|uniref:DNA-binding transcriptional LysR family regulator n=1 Tax=Mumia flava TaxID=1348852 RepID=A0A0B2BBF0_9ACTN|nr:LysR family transcriptional regulator [Mumia flava]PJJ56160.1 DNA-binding transcriptional LysR family regulator [Mumia flava]
MIDHRLHVLRMVAAHGSVTAAATALHFTPSAVSHQLRTLARDLDVTLLVHEGRGVRLTAAARTLLTHADDLFARWEEIKADLAVASEERAEELRLCGFSTAAAALLPHVAARSRATRPHLSVRIIEADPDECFDRLLNGDADLAVVVSTPTLPSSLDARFDQEPLLDDPLDLLVPEGHRLADQSSVSLADAADEPWILDHPGRPHHQLVVTACAAAGFTPYHAHEAVEWDTGAALTAAGFGVSMAPRLARLPAGYPIVRVPLSGSPSPARHVLTAVRQGSRRHPAIADALTFLEEAAARSRVLSAPSA